MSRLSKLVSMVNLVRRSNSRLPIFPRPTCDNYDQPALTFEPELHLLHLLRDGRLGEHFRWHIREGDGLVRVVSLVVDGHVEAVVVVARAELNAVHDHVQLAHTHRAAGGNTNN